MADHTPDMLRSAIRAMQEVVLPAVDRQHPLALEQATLVTRILQLLEQRLPWLGARSRFELAAHAALAGELAGDADAVSPAIAGALGAAATAATALLADSAATPPQQQACAREIGGLVATLVEVASATAEAERRQRIERKVLEHTAAILDMQRAWFLPQGWEPDPGAVPPLERLLQPPA